MTVASAAPVLADHSKDVGAYFTSIRIPAAFVAGASFGAMWGLKNPYDGDKKISVKEYLATVYHVLVTVSFVLSLLVVVVSTASFVRYLHDAPFPPIKSGYMLLKTEFGYEFVLTRWSFLVSLMSFITGVTCRVLVEFDLLALEGGEHRRRRRELGLGLACAMSGLICHLLSFVNTTLFCWNNMFDMTLDLGRMMLGRVRRDTPMLALSVALVVSAVIFVLKASLGPLEDKSHLTEAAT